MLYKDTRYNLTEREKEMERKDIIELEDIEDFMKHWEEPGGLNYVAATTELPPIAEILEEALDNIYSLVDHDLQKAEIKALLDCLVDEHVEEWDE